MRTFASFTLIALLAAAPAFAQSAGSPTGGTMPPRPVHRVMHAGMTKPVDHGPFTAEADRAYQGGGMILQGAPGAPPPRPMPTPPGQTPSNLVPQ